MQISMVSLKIAAIGSSFLSQAVLARNLFGAEGTSVQTQIHKVRGAYGYLSWFIPQSKPSILLLKHCSASWPFNCDNGVIQITMFYFQLSGLPLPQFSTCFLVFHLHFF